MGIEICGAEALLGDNVGIFGERHEELSDTEDEELIELFGIDDDPEFVI